MARYSKILLLCALLAGCASPSEQHQQTRAEQLVRAQHMYACSYFFSAGKKTATDKVQKEKLGRISQDFLHEATMQAVAADEDKDPTHLQLEAELSSRGRRDMLSMMKSTDGMQAGPERDAIFTKFIDECRQDLQRGKKAVAP